jgi:hypothetical protein
MLHLRRAETCNLYLINESCLENVGIDHFSNKTQRRAAIELL